MLPSPFRPRTGAVLGDSMRRALIRASDAARAHRSPRPTQLIVAGLPWASAPPWAAKQLVRPRCASTAVERVGTELAHGEAESPPGVPPWGLRLRREQSELALFPSELPESDGTSEPAAGLSPAALQRLASAPARTILDAALEIADGFAVVAKDSRDTSAEAAAALRSSWIPVQSRLKQLEIDSADAVLVLHCMVSVGCFDRTLMAKIADRIECLYFSTNEATPDCHPALGRFARADTFKSLVCGLPLSHKVKLVLLDAFPRDRGFIRRAPPEPEADAKTMWRTMDPIDMEESEKIQFKRGRIKLKRIRHVQAKETRMQPGKKLRNTIAFSLLQELPGARAAALAEMSHVFAFGVRLLRGDLQDDFQEAFCREVCKFDTHNLLLFVLALSSAMRNFAGPEALRAWRLKLIPGVLRVCKAEPEKCLLERQRAVHPRLQGVPVPQEPALTKSDTALPDVRLRADRAARLFYSVASARQVKVDCQLFDVLAAPLKAAVQEWLNGAANGEDAQPLLPFELIADVLGAAAATGIRDRSLAATLGRLIVKQFGESASLQGHAPADLAVAANGLALLANATSAEAPLRLLWTAAAPGLRKTEPAYALMLLDAVVRLGPEDLIASPSFLEAADEFVAQRLDLDIASLGHLCD